MGSSCCCLLVLPVFTLSTATVCVMASWRACSVTFEDGVVKKGKGDFSAKTAVRSWTASTNRSFASTCGIVQ